MFAPLICGSLNHQDQEDDEQVTEAWKCSLSSTPRKLKKLSLCRNKGIKNPYSDRGLDKFTALLADLDRKRQKIFTQKGSENISLVRFAYTNSDDLKPIIIKVRGKKRSKMTTSVDQEAINKSPTDSPTHKKVKMEFDQQGRKKCEVKVEDWRWPTYYLPLIMILILFGLVLFGRSFTILCTTIGWYLVPRFENGKPYIKRMNKKRQYGKISSNMKVTSEGISSPRSVLNGLDVTSPRITLPYGKVDK